MSQIAPARCRCCQYALTELFDERQGDLIPTRAYQDLGGAAGALARRAETVYLGLDERGQGDDAAGHAPTGQPRRR